MIRSSWNEQVEGTHAFLAIVGDTVKVSGVTMRGTLKSHRTFRLNDVVPKSAKRNQSTTDRCAVEPLARQETVHHFQQTLAKSKWDVVKGFHTFRHSFASNLAEAGVRQEVIDGLMGHQTEDMRRRYRHLFPHEMEDALRKVFGVMTPR